MKDNHKKYKKPLNALILHGYENASAKEERAEQQPYDDTTG